MKSQLIMKLRLSVPGVYRPLRRFPSRNCRLSWRLCSPARLPGSLDCKTFLLAIRLLISPNLCLFIYEEVIARTFHAFSHLCTQRTRKFAYHGSYSNSSSLCFVRRNENETETQKFEAKVTRRSRSQGSQRKWSLAIFVFPGKWKNTLPFSFIISIRYVPISILVSFSLRECQLHIWFKIEVCKRLKEAGLRVKLLGRYR